MDKDIRIMLVGNHELIRCGLRRMLEPEEDMEVVGDCATAEEALSKMASLCPNIVLIDIERPGMEGIKATRYLKRNGLNYDGDVIILAESLDYRAEAMEAGAASYLLKDVTRAELTQAIREVYWRHQLSENRHGFVEEAVELVVPPPHNAAQLLRFVCQLEEILNDDYASIIRTVGSWDWGTVITIFLLPPIFSRLLDQLCNMSGVEKVEEESLARGSAFASFPKKFGALPRLSISPSKRIRVILRESSMVRQEPLTTLN